MSEIRMPIRNGAQYLRSGPVQVDLDELGLDRVNGLADASGSLSLYRGPERKPVPFQIDCVFGAGMRPRILSFFARDIAPGNRDYDGPATDYVLCNAASTSDTAESSNLRMDFYHEPRLDSESGDGHSSRWDRTRRVVGINLANAAIEIHFRTGSQDDSSLAGSVTSVNILDAQMRDVLSRHGVPFEVLDPHFLEEPDPSRHWGKVNRLVLPSTPWGRVNPSAISLTNNSYELIWAQCGPVRATITVASPAFDVRYEMGSFGLDQCMRARLFRILSVFSGSSPSYVEEQMLVAELECPKHVEGSSEPTMPCDALKTATRALWLPFESHSSSRVCAWPLGELHRLEHLPQYFSLWRQWYEVSHGYALATDPPLQFAGIHEPSINWSTPCSRVKRMVHQFSVGHKTTEGPLDAIGHSGWWETLLRPIGKDLSQWFPSP